QALEGRQEPSAACVPEISNEVLGVGADGGERLAVGGEGETADGAALAKAHGPQARDGAGGQGIVPGLGTGGNLCGPCQDERCEPPQDGADHDLILWSCGLPVRIRPGAEDRCNKCATIKACPISHRRSTIGATEISGPQSTPPK